MDNTSMKTKLKLYFRILGLAWHIRRRAFIGYMVGAVIQSAATILAIYATAQIGNLLARYVAGQSTDKIWFWLAIEIFSAVLISLSFWLMGYCKRLLYFKLSTWSTNQFMAALCTIDLPDYYDDVVRNRINKASNGYSWQISNLTETCLDLVYAVIRLLAIAVIVAQITWWLIPLVAILLVPSLINEAKLARVQWFVWDDDGDARHVFWRLDWILKQPYAQFELRSMQARGYIRDKIDNMNRSFYKKQERVFNRVSRETVPAKILEASSVGIGSVVLIRQFLQGAIAFDRFLFLSGALIRIVGELNNVFGTMTRMQEPFLFAENYFALIDRKPTHIDKPDATELKSGGAPKIEFKNIGFTYPGQDTPVFENLNLTITPGEHIAIVGENGAGKSTLIKLLMRFYKPTSGCILIDGIDLEDIAIESWYEQLATLFQTFNEYPFPVKENIELARPEYNKYPEKLQEAAEFGGINEMVKQYPHAWDTVLDSSFEKGTEPSGGQWQRVALARTFYRDANVLILDEPTAAIDAMAEYEIFNNIFDHYKDKTVLIISHRFSTVRRADRILVVDEGKIIEQGSHKDLMKKQALYHEMFTKQAEGYR